MDRMKMESPDMTAQNVERIGTLFPNCVTETVDEDGKPKKAINFELLKQMLSPDVVDGDECYEFTWVGKKAAIVEANKPIRKTLRPCVEESKNWDTTENLYIEGDNLEVLKLLQESYLGKVKMIYIDPPYNTGNDFIYADDFMRSQEEENQQMGMPYSSEQIDGCIVHTYNDGDLIACFSENAPDSVVKEIARRQPLRVVFRDSSFANSPAKINVTEIFKLLAPDTRVKVI